MGKAAKLKAIRRFANHMPAIEAYRVQGEKVRGYDLLQEGVREVMGTPVDPAGYYTRKAAVKVPLNHNKTMKKLYNKHGIVGVQSYINAVEDHAKQFNETATT